jgi:hypothetical protein
LSKKRNKRNPAFSAEINAVAGLHFFAYAKNANPAYYPIDIK